jgi:hypothetical protein
VREAGLQRRWLRVELAPRAAPGIRLGRDGGERRGRLAPFWSLRALHSRHVLHWPVRARPGWAGAGLGSQERVDRNVAIVPGCGWNLGSKWNRVEGTGVQGPNCLLELREKAGELGAGLRSPGRVRSVGALSPIRHPSLRGPLQLGPQAHADDSQRGQRPVPALSHHGCQVRVDGCGGKG